MITILCAGTRGDVQPFLALAVELKKLGRAVRIATSRNHESFVRAYGVDFYKVDVDYESLQVDPAVIRQAQQADNPLKVLLSFQKLKKFGAHMVEAYYSACEDSSLVVYHPGVATGFYAAERLGIPAVLATPYPLHKTRERPSVLLYGKVRSTPLLNRVSYSFLQGMLWMAAESSLRPFWKKKFGSLPPGFGAPFERHRDARHPALVAGSNFVFPRPTDWNEHVHQHGYWFLDEPDGFIPPPGLVEFLERGEPPVYIGFGSMFGPEQADRALRTLQASLERVGKRAVLGGMGVLPDASGSLFAVEQVPHSWLFERVAAVCHHAGAGTTAAALRSGKPQVVVPFALDQPAWARRMHELGVSAKPLPFKKLSVEGLTLALEAALQEETARKAAALGEKVAAENGAAACARLIAGLL